MGNITESDYRCAYKEVITILNVIDFRLKKMIPKEKIEFYEKNLDKSHSFEYDYSKSINEQNILYPTRCIIANLFRDYIATDKDRVEIIKREKEEIRKIEEEKKKRYNVDSIFSNDVELQNNGKLVVDDPVDSSKELISVLKEKSIFEIIKCKICDFINKIKNKR